MSAVGNGSQQHAEVFLLFGAIWYAESSAATKKKKKPVRTLGNHVHSAGVHEKEIRETDRKKERTFVPSK